MNLEEEQQTTKKDCSEHYYLLNPKSRQTVQKSEAMSNHRNSHIETNLDRNSVKIDDEFVTSTTKINDGNRNSV